MARSVTFYYDYGSPTCYLAWTQLPRICDSAGATLVKRPILLGGIFKSIGHLSPITIPAKAAWMFADLERFARYYGVAFKRSAAFPFNSVPAMRAATWAARNGHLDAFDDAMFTAAWVTGDDIGDLGVIRAAAARVGLDVNALSTAAQTSDIKTALIDATGEAVAAGAFGAPTFIVDGVLHFGQDRLPWIERALTV